MDEVEEVALGDLVDLVDLGNLVDLVDLVDLGDLAALVALAALAGLDAFVGLLDLAGLVAFVGLANLPNEVELLAFRISAFLLKGRLYTTHATYPTRPTRGTQHEIIGAGAFRHSSLVALRLAYGNEERVTKVSATFVISKRCDILERSVFAGRK